MAGAPKAPLRALLEEKEISHMYGRRREVIPGCARAHIDVYVITREREKEESAYLLYVVRLKLVKMAEKLRKHASEALAAMLSK